MRTGRALFKGEGGRFVIGPGEEQWDLAMLVEQASHESFFAFASQRRMSDILAHRTAALVNSRLLPLVPLARHLPTPLYPRAIPSREERHE
ncbi:hypothetical protein [Aurantiacibacter gilvus]|uniref:Uncharacterized protein n=1 Tax=Aurantiacibacter gilvus TaxID=3139141 RepID=A0ABU9IB63_9SPHN